MSSVDPQDWKTTDMVRAERDLDEAVDRAAEQFERLDQKLARLDAEEAPPTDEEIDQFRQTVTGPSSTPHWRLIAQRVAEGSLTWRAVVDGSALGDPDVTAALNSVASVRAATLVEKSTTRPRLPRRTVTDDEYFEDYSVFRKDSR